MTDQRPRYCTPSNFPLGLRLIGTLSKVYNESTLCFRGVIRSRDKACVVFVPSPQPIGDAYLRVISYDQECVACDYDQAILAMMRDTVSIVCPLGTKIVALNVEMSELSYEGLLSALEPLLTAVPSVPAHVPCVVPGTNPPGLAVQTSGGWDPEML